MIDIGKMDHRIELMKPVQDEDKGFGGKRSWISYAVWAEFLRPRFQVAAGAVGSGDAIMITQGIRIRPHEVAKGWHVSYGMRIYKVLHVDDSVPGELILTCKEVVT